MPDCFHVWNLKTVLYSILLVFVNWSFYFLAEAAKLVYSFIIPLSTDKSVQDTHTHIIGKFIEGTSLV